MAMQTTAIFLRIIPIFFCHPPDAPFFASAVNEKPLRAELT